MKILFLDIDGVLNSELWDKSEKKSLFPYPINQFDPCAVNLLNKILEETQATIVLSSTWRLQYDLDYMNALFAQIGIQSKILDFTPDLKKGNDYVHRGNEIYKWCKDNQHLLGTKLMDYTDFAILDDSTDMLLWQAKFFFQTDRLCGLSPTVAKNLIRSL